MKRPLIILAFSFSLGIFFASCTRTTFIFFYCLAVIFLFLSSLSFKRIFLFDIFLFCLVFCLGAVLLKNYQNLAACHIVKFISYKSDSPYVIKGIIESQPELKNGRQCFIFKAKAIRIGNLNRNCCGSILVYLRSRRHFCYGEELILLGNLYRPFSKNIRQGNNYKDYLFNQGIFYIMNVKTEAGAARLNQNKGLMIKRAALWLKNRMEGIIYKYTSLITAAILEAMVLGEKRDIPYFLTNMMMKTGTVHILVVSGFNVGIAAFIVITFLKLIRLPRKVRLGLAIVCLILYCLMTGASNPVVRATVMAIVFISAYLIKREPDICNSLSLAAVFILALNPRQLFDIGFQLSFASVIAIIYLYPKIKSLLRLENLRIKPIRFLVDSCLVSLSAWLGTAGFIAYYFKIFSPVTVLANILIVPLAALITLCGFSLMLISLIFPFLAPLFASTSELAVLALVKINAFLVQIPFAYLNLS